ncbi:2-amino-4-hydroxy-6-hydroxymethyldihydropteridine diphosphokinase [Luteimonas wenzhouensis]|jgi:2-amino-4-hydroxy-6-hydroxymethyldihydropteridine diphosphokinase|uniref:2-amino-4-hydroxy-6-hydroxymethyldihydropteridine pyrophosphokinase n=1 Tax=Luteimonas wenzhouensis TaxID=2599615 RepID=A0A5C5U456_9GAMM|nr:2-amino-4-hydroxy-6-hydroxymethyldihydropteridine diphosphokinase [Luteimonas wenzhouensis]NLW97504.1 2-amino-4-hydroxy-6-hydroxymethyldihydropteridine diphosphokinase [Xanthomonadaceae bacterium]TWT20498.1 2-amino-4-hydroxy-6-hydroxymethyldihydropteridine diphosphokinase [Luteimonas wenzhouensis]
MNRTQACVGLGGNLGEVARTLAAALEALDGLADTRLLRASRLYRTPAWGHAAQPDFLNAAAVVETSLPARALLDALLAIERRFGRARGDGPRWGPRTLDLDLLLYGESVIDAPGLQVPHPHLHERAFALVPLAEVAPGARIPGHGTVAAALSKLDATGIEAIP